MFSGIVESIGTINTVVDQHECKLICLTPDIPMSDLTVNDSLAVNGVCLTVTACSTSTVELTAVPETLRRTTLQYLQPATLVNLERALQFNHRIGGHFVQGHVDCMGKISELEVDGDALLVKVKTPPTIMKYIVNKGFITIDGMSITAIDTGQDWFTVTFIPHTRAVSITQYYQLNTKVNLEVDILGKYVEKLLTQSRQ